MQNKYESLNPEMQYYQGYFDRDTMFSKREREAKGGLLPATLGYTLSITAMSMMTLRAQREGFTFFPLARHKTP